MEYYFQSSLGLVALTPCPGLPSAVELRVADKILGRYLSAEEAARAVSSSLTGHAELDALPCSKVPVLLSEWKQSVPHYFASGASGPKSEEDAEGVEYSDGWAELEVEFAF